MNQPDHLIDNLLRGAIDTHVHSFPDVVDRKLNDLEIVEQAKSSGISGLVIKCHYGCTSERAWHLNQVQSDVQVLGGIVLNHQAGGFNPHAVEAAIALGAAQIWMPTKSAANHQRHLGGSDGISIFDEGRIRTEVFDILKQIADTDVVLATGHLSPEESSALVYEALALGVHRISITHPEWGVTAMPVEVQQELSKAEGVYFERCAVSVQPDLPFCVGFDTIVRQILEVGVETTIIATDFGMPQYDTPAIGLRNYIGRLVASGFSEEEIRRMTSENPRTLLKFHLPNPGPA